VGAGEAKGKEWNILENRWGRHGISNRRYGETAEASGKTAVDERGVGRSIETSGAERPRKRKLRIR
jgi:hypothetical protein